MAIHGFDMIIFPSLDGEGIEVQSLVETDTEEETDLVNRLVDIRLAGLELPQGVFSFREWIGDLRLSFAECISHHTGQEHIPTMPAQSIVNKMITNYGIV